MGRQTDKEIETEEIYIDLEQRDIQIEGVDRQKDGEIEKQI